MPPMEPLLSVEEALDRVLERVPPPVAADSEPDLEVAIGAVVFADVHADADYPRWPRSRVDGYALRAADASGPLQVVAHIAAGKPPGDRIGPGQAARIFTGGVVPSGADAVLKQEDADLAGEHVTARAAIAAGDNVAPRASECAAGAVVARRGTVITPGVAGALGAIGCAKVRVARRPHAVVLTTGNELVPVTQMPPPGRIRNSNAPALMAAMWSYGAWPEALPIAPDARPALDDAVASALEREPALLLVTGGVSVGDFDLVPQALAEAGVERVFHGVRVQPGKPLWFGVRGATLVFGLPGNPVSALVNAALFVRPAVRKLLGRDDVMPETMAASLGGDVAAGGRRRRYVPCRTACADDGRLVATPVRFAGSGDVFGFAAADGLVIVPEDAPARRAGDACRVVPLAGTAR